MGAKGSRLSDLKDGDLKGKRVFVRADLNVPLDVNHSVTDDTKLRAAVPTIDYLIRRRAKVIICSHLGRPDGVTPIYSFRPLVSRLSKLLGVEVKMANDCVGEEVQKMVAAILDGGVLLLENVRFHHEEKENDPEFARQLASLADVYVNDAFGTAHRAHASTEGMAKYFKTSVPGFLMQKELDFLDEAVLNPKKPATVIVGGPLSPTMSEAISSALEEVNTLVLGGGMIYPFLKAKGYAVGSSFAEEDQVEVAAALMKKAEDKGVTLMLPTDFVIVNKFAATKIKVVPAAGIPVGGTVVDIGPDSIKAFSETLATSRTILWSGPMGVAGFEQFGVGTNGTRAIAMTLAKLKDDGVVTIVGGGDTIAALKKHELADRISHITTGFGAFIEFLKGKTLPAVAALDAKKKGGMGRKAKKLAKTMLNKGKALVVTVIGGTLIACLKDAIKRCGDGEGSDDENN